MSRRARFSQPELSDDDGPPSDPGYHYPSSSKSKTWTEVSTQTPITSLGFWNDQKIWILIVVFLLCQILTSITVVHFKRSLENNITNLKSCQKRIANSEESLPCSDCMCIATDGFSSKEFFDVVKNQKRGEEKYKELKSQLLEYKSKVKELEVKLSEYENPNKDITELFDENWDRRKDNLIKEIDEKETSLRNSLVGKVKEEVQIKSQNIQSQLDQQHGSITEITGKIQQVNELVTELKDEVNTVKTDSNTLMDNYQSLEGNQSKTEEKLKSVENELKGLGGHLDHVSSEISEIILYFIVFLLVVVIAVILAAPKLMPYRQPQTADRTVPPGESHPKQRVGGQEMSHTAIYATLSSKKCKRGISIISFHSATQKFHQNLLKFVSRPQALPMQSYLIENQVDLSEVNPYLVTIIFVDFNERNIILENPEIEVGDHRRFTTEIFLELGCDVFVIYCKDRGSQTLPPNQLYNTKLHSINQHATLVKLKKKNRVFSVYESLHPQQVELLEDCLKQL